MPVYVLKARSRTKTYKVHILRSKLRDLLVVLQDLCYLYLESSSPNIYQLYFTFFNTKMVQNINSNNSKFQFSEFLGRAQERAVPQAWQGIPMSVQV